MIREAPTPTKVTSPEEELKNAVGPPADAGSTVTFGVFKVELTLLGDTLLKNSISFLP
ncbi:hypothetical protein [uncultured Trichococcus sp.]|uniref:hypothetical protein n=1 Tax=uncultured Trichococcus sp. TaxID=189665 RepID=UPI0029C959BF|nr:hypothetical protein [uncultured Trichococcus sp.]